MLENDAQMRNQSVNYFSIIHTQYKFIPPDEQSANSMNTRIHVNLLSFQMPFILVLQITRVNIPVLDLLASDI